VNVNNVRSQIIDGVEINTHFDKGPFFIDGVTQFVRYFFKGANNYKKK